MAMDTWFCAFFVTVCSFVMFKSSYQTLLKIATKKLNVQKVEDYTFEWELTRAKDECSYISFVNDTVRNKTIQRIKEKIAERKVEEFYKQKEEEKRRAKKFYENVKRETWRKVLEGERPEGGPGLVPRGPFPPPPPPPLPPLSPPSQFLPRTLYKRSTMSQGRRRKGSTSFSEVSFMDHNNCSSRCLFARMEMVNEFGFPDESLVTKLIDDKISNKRIRLLKTRRVASCFKKMEEVAIDDSCIFATKLFECLDLGESSSWSSNK